MPRINLPVFGDDRHLNDIRTRLITLLQTAVFSGTISVTASGSTTLQLFPSVALCNATAGNQTILLPAATTLQDGTFFIKKTDSSTNTVTIMASGAELIDAATTFVLSVQYDSVFLVSNGTKWSVLSRGAVANSLVEKIEVAKAAALVATRKRLNFIDGSNITVTVADNTASDRADITIASASGLTVQESDGSPTVGGVTTINIDQATGLTVTTGAATASVHIGIVPVGNGGTGQTSTAAGYIKGGANFSIQTTPIPTGDLGSGTADSTTFLRGDQTWALAIPAGVIVPYGGSSAPTAWLLCDGSAVSRTGSNAALFAAIGTTFGTGNGSTTFNVPDMRSRFPLGAGAGVGLTARTLATTGGGETLPNHVHTLSSHTHTMGSHTHTLAGGTVVADNTGVGSFSTTTGGPSTNTSGGPSTANTSNPTTNPDNMNPWLALTYIIKT